MDPNATLRMIDDTLITSDEEHDEVDELCDDLHRWIAKGGFEPNWKAYPLATDYYQCRANARLREQGAELLPLF